jgi:hypothetical protein
MDSWRMYGTLALWVAVLTVAAVFLFGNWGHMRRRKLQNAVQRLYAVAYWFLHTIRAIDSGVLAYYKYREETIRAASEAEYPPTLKIV